MKKCFFSLFLILSAVFVFWSCQSVDSPVLDPNVSLNSVEVAEISFDGVELIVNVDVLNPNRFAIPMPNIAWALSVNEAPFLQGDLSNSGSIGRRQSATLALPLSFTFEGLYRAFESLVEFREVTYAIALGISFPVPVIADRVFALDFSGVLPLPQFPVLSLVQARIANIDFSGVELAWEINVENPNSFPIPIPNLNVDYSVNGVPVEIRTSIDGAGSIAAGAAGLALITVSVAYADIFSAVGTSLRPGDAVSNLSLGIDPTELGFPLLAATDSGLIRNLLDISGTLPILQLPVISFQGISRRSLGLNRFEFDVIWEVVNNNSFGFGIFEFNCEVMVNNILWTQGRIENPPRIAANGRTLIPINVVITTPAVVQGLLPILSGGGNVNYTAIGNMSFLPDFPDLGNLNIPLDFSGSTRIR